MASCELCGKSNVNTKPVKVAGTVMNVCSLCNSFGSSMEKKGPISHTFYKKVKEEENLVVCKNYSSLISSTLAKKNLTLHHLAKALNIKESTLNKAISGKIHLELETARRIEKFLEITLIEDAQPVRVDDYLLGEKEEEVSNSLGDLLKKKLNK